MRILGVDPGLNITGVGIIEATNSSCVHVHHAAIRTRTTDDLATRLVVIRDGIRALASEHGVLSAAVESSFVGTNARSALALGHARAAAILGLCEAGASVAEYAPAMVKQTVAGYGRSEKQQVGRLVAMQLGLSVVPTPEDAADALAVAITHWAHSRLQQPIAAR